jgi:hypothetical protein
MPRSVLHTPEATTTDVAFTFDVASAADSVAACASGSAAGISSDSVSAAAAVAIGEGNMRAADAVRRAGSPSREKSSARSVESRLGRARSHRYPTIAAIVERACARRLQAGQPIEYVPASADVAAGADDNVDNGTAFAALPVGAAALLPPTGIAGRLPPVDGAFVGVPPSAHDGSWIM